MKVNKVAILGAGNGGLTAAADLTQKGFKVNIFESNKFCKNLQKIKENNEITIEYKDNVSVEKINLITTDITEAIEDCQIIMITVPGMGIEYFAEILAPVLKEEQIVLINGAPAMSAVRFMNRAKEIGINKNIKVGETNSLTYATRAFPEERRVSVSLKAGKVYLAAYPSHNTDEVYDACVQIYDCFVKAQNVIQVNLENPNPLVHPGPTLLNAGRIDYSQGEFWLYKEGITEHTVNIIKAVQDERGAIANAYDIELEDVNQGRINRGYFVDEEKPLQELFNTSPVFKHIKGPATVTGRYIVEDISTGLVLWSDLGKAVGVSTPNIDAIIVLGGTLIQRDFYKEGLTLDSIGLGNLKGKEEVIANI